MSANQSIWRSPVSVLAAFALGAAAAAGCGALLASLMASQKMGPAAAWPFATAAVCVGSLLGGWVLALLCVQLASGGIPDAAQLARLALVALAGAAGGSAGVRKAGKKRRH